METTDLTFKITYAMNHETVVYIVLFIALIFSCMVVRDFLKEGIEKRIIRHRYDCRNSYKNIKEEETK